MLLVKTKKNYKPLESR